jgi:hypothetical protein
MNMPETKKEGTGKTGWRTGRPATSFFSIPMFFLLLFATFSLCSLSPAHDYHVSVTQMQYNSGSKTFEISIRIFTDDLERALGYANGNKRFVVKNGDANDAAVSAYISKNFSFTTNQQKTLPIRYIGKEQEDDATWVYIELPFQVPVKGSKLQNSILTEIFDDQVNMTNVTTPAGKKTYMYKKGQLVHVL